jgi:hypothetical protein
LARKDSRSLKACGVWDVETAEVDGHIKVYGDVATHRRASLQEFKEVATVRPQVRNQKTTPASGDEQKETMARSSFPSRPSVRLSAPLGLPFSAISFFDIEA